MRMRAVTVAAAAAAIILLPSPSSAHEEVIIGDVRMTVGLRDEPTPVGEPTTIQVEFTTVEKWATLPGPARSVESVAATCRDSPESTVAPAKPAAVEGTVHAVEVPFTPFVGEQYCMFRVIGTIDGRRYEHAIEHWIDTPKPDGGGDDDAGDSRSGLVLPVAGAVALLGLVAGGGTFAMRRRRRPGGGPAGDVPASFVGGRYVSTRFLGEGATKRVYLVRDTRLDRDVAFALVRAEGLDSATLERVRREALTLAKLSDHPNVVTVHDTGDEGGAPYLITEYLDAGSVEDLIAGGPVPLERTLQVGVDVCRALEHAHAQGVVHRDVKPSNVWLSRDGAAKLGDFGLAAAADRSKLTAQGTMLGTVAYMPPEQVEGTEADARSDLYSVGALLYHMVVGRPPFTGDVASTLYHQVHTAAPRASAGAKVPRALDNLIASLLEKDPGARPASASDVREKLESVASAARVSLTKRKAFDEAPSRAPRAAGETAIDAVTTSVSQRVPDLSVHARDGTVTLMFTDIESSTPMLEKLGDRGFLEVIRHYDRVVRRQVAQHSGDVVDTAGDGFLVAFSSARDALHCAIDVQRELKTGRVAGQRLRVRIGVHTGEAIKDASRFIGRHVHLAARVASKAVGGQVLVSSVTRELVRGERFEFDEPRTEALAGIADEQLVFPLVWSK